MSLRPTWRVYGAGALWLVLEWYGATSEVSWLFLLAGWVLVLVVAAAGYAAWNRTGLSLRLGVASSAPAADSPAEQLPEQVLRTSPFVPPVFEGDRCGLEVGLQASRGPRGPVWTVGQVAGREVSAAADVVPRSGWTQVRPLRAVRRGAVGAHGWRIYTSDPLGFFLGTRAVADSEVMLALPRFTSLSARRQVRELEASIVAPRAGSGGELFGVREYRPGDSLRRIHWRASARHGELVVREYEPPGLPTLTIVVDPAPRADDVADQIARIAASEAWDCIRDGGRVVLWGGEDAPVGPTRDLWSVLDWLARYPQAASGPAGHFLPKGEEAVVVTADPALLEIDAVRHWLVGGAGVDSDVAFERVGTEWPIR